MIRLVIPGAPVAKPRQTRRDKWMQRPCVMRYRAWENKVRGELIRQLARIPDGPIGVVAYFDLPLPKRPGAGELPFSWHDKKPDLDNALKGALDAAFHDQGRGDQRVAVFFSRKVWAAAGTEGQTILHLGTADEIMDIAQEGRL